MCVHWTTAVYPFVLVFIGIAVMRLTIWSTLRDRTRYTPFIMRRGTHRVGGGSLIGSLIMFSAYLGHLGLHPGGFQRRHRLLCCRWAVKIHKAIS